MADEGDNHGRYMVTEKRAQRKIENDGGNIEFSHGNMSSNAVRGWGKGKIVWSQTLLKMCTRKWYKNVGYDSYASTFAYDPTRGRRVQVKHDSFASSDAQNKHVR